MLGGCRSTRPIEIGIIIGPSERRGLLGLYGADAPRPARERGSHEPAAASTMDRNRPDQLVLVRPTAVHRPWRRLERLAGPAMGESGATGDHCSSPACVRDCLTISPRGGGLTQRWPLPRGRPTPRSRGGLSAVEPHRGIGSAPVRRLPPPRYQCGPGYAVRGHC